MITNANQQYSAEERMMLAIGIGTTLPVDIALAIIEASQANTSLSPLTIALKLKKGDSVRVSEEILEVAGFQKIQIVNVLDASKYSKK